MDSDVYYNILLNASLDILKNLCLINPNVIQHCNNIQFWIDKFNQDRLPLLVSSYPTTLSDWISEYEKITQIKHKAANILLINEIEITRDTDRTPGVISITIFDKYKNILRSILPHELSEKLSELYLKEDRDYPVSLDIQLLPQGTYTINYVVIPEQEPIITSINSNYNEVLDVLTKFIYYDYDHDAEILDDRGLYFEIQSDLEDHDNDSKRILYKRLAMWDTIKFLKI